ncbi:hypothetical protein [Agromyces sp. C10]|uniref:hypothetical protein n=1 Tax=Agromyces sp. C10 TaxID=2935077 RepID=UPI00200B2CAC|nr:hypothetical protein [Agromyces sp. C10]MCK8608267.1 hypothetical protein [Agromyces sp. C10]
MPGPRPFRALSRAAAIPAVTVVLLATVGCTTPPWLETSATTPATTSPTESATTTPSAAPVQNDLAAGSATKTLEVGAMTLTIDYWSTLTMDQWTAAATKPLSIAMRATITPDDGQRIYLSRLTAAPVVVGPDGALDSPTPIVDQATVAPGYLILDPYSYSQTVTLPAVDPTAIAIQVDLRYELLQQSTPQSNDYAKQTAVDTLTIAIAPSG